MSSVRTSVSIRSVSLRFLIALARAFKSLIGFCSPFLYSGSFPYLVSLLYTQCVYLSTVLGIFFVEISTLTRKKPGQITYVTSRAFAFIFYKEAYLSLPLATYFFRGKSMTSL